MIQTGGAGTGTYVLAIGADVIVVLKYKITAKISTFAMTCLFDGYSVFRKRDHCGGKTQI